MISSGLFLRVIKIQDPVVKSYGSIEEKCQTMCYQRKNIKPCVTRGKMSNHVLPGEKCQTMCYQRKNVKPCVTGEKMSNHVLPEEKCQTMCYQRKNVKPFVTRGKMSNHVYQRKNCSAYFFFFFLPFNIFTKQQNLNWSKSEAHADDNKCDSKF